MAEINDYESLYNPESNRYIPGWVAEDYEECKDSFSYKAEVVLETPIDKTLKAVVNEVL